MAKYKIGQQVRLCKPLYGIYLHEAGKIGEITYLLDEDGEGNCYITMLESTYIWSTPLSNLKPVNQKGEQLEFAFMEEA